MKINIFEKCLGSGFFTGYIPFASGTFGSLAALLIYYIPGFSNPPVIITVIIFFAFYGIYVGTKFEKIYGKDPAECTIDEVVGMWITLLFVPKTIMISLTGFLIWRLLDIIKPFPARQAEKLQGGLGIMLDDVIAGAYSLIILQVILIIFKY
ncbi:MAG: phosphatidylglycerophosphatase A [Ignavibacteriaceae bacterium]|jgi:phosphatidylglycerophosphatase A